ncbi:MAG: hypothetical protein KGK08_13925 [Acidobacteriota bacterium]|nr:hypothetical protein [Acidobacteriota bacterium]
MTAELMLAVDQGTTNTKAVLVGRDGAIRFVCSAPLELLQPQPGWVEQDALALWESVVSVVQQAAAFAAAHGARIAGLALSNQRETAAAWRRSGEPVAHAITWQCRRTAQVCARLAESAGRVAERTGLPLDPLVSASKWAWLLEQRPELRAEAEQGAVLLGTVDAWLVYRLTGGRVHATDHTNASRTALLRLDTLTWDPEMMALFGVPLRAMPVVQPSVSSYGVCTAIPELRDVPIVAVLGDSHAAVAGHGCYQPGFVKATYGTGSSLMLLVDQLPAHATTLARTLAWSTVTGPQYALEGNITMAGSALQWVGEFLGLPAPAEDAARLAATVPDAQGVIFVPAMVGLGAPYWDTAARGAVLQLERFHKAAHLARAAVEAIAHQVADVLDAMEHTTGGALQALHADGGATRNAALMQFQADVLGRPVLRSAAEELSARGAALLGGLQLGWWPDFAAMERLPHAVIEFVATMDTESREQRRRAWQHAVARVRSGREPQA